MKYYNFKAGGRDYRLRLTAQSIIDIEGEFGKSFISVFTDVANSGFPSMKELLVIFEKALKTNSPDISTQEVYDIYDKYIDEGNSLTDFVEVVVGLVMDSGVLGKALGEKRVPSQRKKYSSARR